MPVAGDTFILTRQTGDVPHLWVLLWGPAGPADAFLAVHLSTWREGRDRSCLIPAGEHPFVQHDTHVVYNNTKRFTAAVLQNAIAMRQAVPRAPVSSPLLERLRAGFFASPFTPHAMIEFARTEFGAAQQRAGAHAGTGAARSEPPLLYSDEWRLRGPAAAGDGGQRGARQLFPVRRGFLHPLSRG